MISRIGVALLVLGLSGFGLGQEARPQPPRFERQYPLPRLPGAMFDMRQYGVGIADRLARRNGWQGRMLWIDCTANLDRYNTEQKIVDLVARIADSGFNTIVFDVKPISGQVVWDSEWAPRLREWRGRTLPAGFEPIPIFSREARRRGLMLYLALNAFSEGHRMFRAGPGYTRKDLQTVLYEPVVMARVGIKAYPIWRIPNAADAPETHLVAYQDATKLPQPQDGAFAVSLDADGRVVDGFEQGGHGKATIPAGGSIVYGRGAAAQWLRDHAWPGFVVRFTAAPEFVAIEERPEQQIPLMMNPFHPEIVGRNLEIVKELARKFDFDGLLYDDRLRYAGLNADFSPQARDAFETWLGRKVTQWPQDVFRYTFGSNFQRGIDPGRDYENWLMFRAWQMRRYVGSVRQALLSVRPEAQFGVYAGSWYGEYATYGANYGSPELEAGFWYLSRAYAKTGFGDLLDLLVTGCYYRTPTIHEAMRTGVAIGLSIEAAGYLSNRVADDQTWTYAGIMLSDFKNRPSALMQALQAATGSTQGVMVFDLSHDIEPMWQVFKQAFGQPAEPPTLHRSRLKELRRLRAEAMRRGDKRPTVIISSGQAGAGH